MLPRRQSIFHLGEEGGAAVHHHHRVGVVGAAAMAGANGRRAARERDRLVVGLQILVHQQHHHHQHQHHHYHSHGRHAHAHAASIVLTKQMVRPRAAAAAASRHAVSCSFLKACSLCRRDLSPTKDVYMYRGDQGFCSEECRWQKILVDEGRERQAQAAVGSKERQRRGQAHHHSPHRTPNRGRPPPRKSVAVVA